VKRDLIHEVIDEGIREVEDEGIREVEDERMHEEEARKVEGEDIHGVEDEDTHEVEDEDMDLELDLFCFEEVISTEDLGWLTTKSKGCKLLFTELREC